MAQFISGPGQLLPLEYIYPQSVFGMPVTQRGNYISLAPGQAWMFPASGPSGWWVEGGAYSVLQFFDPITQTWRGYNSARRGPMRIQSDGFNYRLANRTGCPIAAVVTGSGTGFVQATTTVAAGTGNSTWYPVVGGTLTVTAITNGTGYSIPPSILIDPPQQQGVQATAYATLGSGTIASIVVDNMGAGYLSAPNVQVVPNPSDPNYIAGTVTNGSAGAQIISANQGKVIAVLCTNSGTVTNAVPALTIAGGGTATCSAVLMSSLTGITIAEAAGGGFNANNMVVSAGGRATYVPAFTNPAVELTGFIPRPANVVMAVSGTLTSIASTYDSGLFTAGPSLIYLQQGLLTTVATLTAAVGGVQDAFFLQPT